MSEKLKKCPFCGNAEIKNGYNNKYDLFCGNCGNFENMKSSWNTRPIEDKLEAKNAELRIEDKLEIWRLEQRIIKLQRLNILNMKEWQQQNKLQEEIERLEAKNAELRIEDKLEIWRLEQRIIKLQRLVNYYSERFDALFDVVNNADPEWMSDFIENNYDNDLMVRKLRC